MDLAPDHLGRRDRLRARLAASGHDRALVTDLVNVRYLSGFSGSNAALMVSVGSEDLLATDGRYTEQAAAESPDLQVVVDRACAVGLLTRAGAARVAFEAHHVTVEEHRLWTEAFGRADLVTLGPVIEDLRRHKDAYELQALREACAAGDRALAELLPWLSVGRTEREIARRLESLMLDQGGDAISFETIVATGANSSIPHHQPTQREVAAGDFLKLDFGAEVAGYHADMTRTLVVGREPDAWQRETYDLVAASQAAGRAAVVDGVLIADVDRASRSVIEDAGLGDRFPHGLGHGVGLQIHEAPLIAVSTAGTLEAGIPVTVEPGVYHPGRGGVRIEDTLVVTHGVPELLTTTTRELLVVGA